MKAVVTGGAGFIGSHLVRALLGRGWEVSVVDDFSLGLEENLAGLVSAGALQTSRGSVCDPALARRLTAGADAVFHLAAMPSVPRSIEQPELSHAINLDATLTWLTAARDAGVGRFVFASSSAIYGDQEAPSKSEDLPVRPLSPYALQKYGAERYCQLYAWLYGLPTVALRYFNVFGPRQRFDSPYSGAIARFGAAILRGEPPTVLGDGLQSRDFTYVDNAVAANLLAASAPAEAVSGRVFNVGGGQGVTLLEVIDELKRRTGVDVGVHFGPPRPGDVRHSLASLVHARERLGYEPLVSWRDGLGRTLDWLRSQRPG